MGYENVDRLDRAIIHHLQRDARTPITDIADAVNVSDNTVRNRIQKLEAEGIIEGYQANVDYDAANIPHHYMVICTARIREREQAARELRRFPSVTEVISLMTGMNNVLIIGVATSKDGITDLAYEVEELGLTIEQEHLVRDHARKPFDGFRLEENV